MTYRAFRSGELEIRLLLLLCHKLLLLFKLTVRPRAHARHPILHLDHDRYLGVIGGSIVDLLHRLCQAIFRLCMKIQETLTDGLTQAGAVHAEPARSTSKKKGLQHTTVHLGHSVCILATLGLTVRAGALGSQRDPLCLNESTLPSLQFAAILTRTFWTPRPLPLSIPDCVFSEERAMVHVHQLAGHIGERLVRQIILQPALSWST